MGFSGTLERTQNVSMARHPRKRFQRNTEMAPGKSFLAKDVILYWYSTIGWLLLNSLATAMLVDVFRFNTEYQSAQQFAVIGLTANVLSYIVLIRGLMRTRKKKSRIRRIVIRLGEGVGIALFALLVTVGGACFTLWLVTEFG